VTLGKLGIQVQRIKLDPYFNIYGMYFNIPVYTKIDSKWINDLDIRTETVKLLGENRGKSS
jgi:hypothetical protein